MKRKTVPFTRSSPQENKRVITRRDALKGALCFFLSPPLSSIGRRRGSVLDCRSAASSSSVILSILMKQKKIQPSQNIRSENERTITRRDALKGALGVGA